MLHQYSVDCDLSGIGVLDCEVHVTFRTAQRLSEARADEIGRTIRAYLVSCASDVRRNADAGNIPPTTISATLARKEHVTQ